MYDFFAQTYKCDFNIHAEIKLKLSNEQRISAYVRCSESICPSLY